MSFIDLVLSSTSEYEAPKRFYYWSALSSISAVLKDSVYFDMGGAYKLYPNIYCLLYGPSGVRKGPAIAIAEQVVKKVDNTRVINGRATIEAIIKDLGTFKSRPGKEPIKDSCGFVVASELSSSIISNPSAMDVMTALYDRIYNTGDWEYKLKVGDSHTLKHPTITWLSGTNEALFKDFLPEKNIHGGLIGRMYMISENRPGNINSLMYAPKVKPDIDKMAELLLPISKLKGEFKTSDEVRDEINRFYHKFVSTIAPTLRDETGFVSRVLDFIMKNAMIISSGRRGDLIIEMSDFEESLEITLPLIVPTKRASQSLKKGDPSLVEKRGLVLTYIARQPHFQAYRKEILKNLGLRLDHEDLNKVIDLMLQMDIVENCNIGGEIIYKLKMDNPKIAEWIKKNYGDES